MDIYGSKELFVREYRQLLAERLLNQLDFDPEKEIRNLELLKLRFDESLLHMCEVMLKDISDSKRINSHIHNEVGYDKRNLPENVFKLTSMVLSSQFWPEFKNDTFELPPEYKEEFDRYTRLFELFKVNRTLCWRHLIGRVTIEVELENRTLEFTVNPLQLAILHHFQNRNKWTLEELCKEMKLQPTILRKRISFWHAQGLIKEPESGVYVLVDHLDSPTAEQIQSQAQECDDDETSSIRSASDQREEELQVFWSYIVGMLTNLDSLPLERIHQMLKMFASHAPGVEFSQEELKNFLQRKVREHKLVFSGAVYHLPK